MYFELKKKQIPIYIVMANKISITFEKRGNNSTIFTFRINHAFVVLLTLGLTEVFDISATG